MRPAVHASILRNNRSQRARRVLRPHSFSMRRLLLLAFIGSLFFIPGIVLTIVGLEKTTEEMDAMMPGQRIMYQAVGPALTSLGVAFLFSACVYYYCYGTGESSRIPGSHQKSFQGSTNSDHNHHHHGHHGHHGHHSHHHHGHHNGSHLDTPDGASRRLSFKEEHPTPKPSPRHPEDEDAEEQVPLAASENTEEGDTLHSAPSATIRRGPAPEEADDNEAQERELLVNGEIPYADEPPV